MNSDSPFTVHGDETLEARIVAWVLGEASAFEAAELERLCEERPELLVFRRRMRALHGLLTEAEAAQPDEGWKLPEEKRRVLDEIFGEENAQSSDPVIEKRVRRAGLRAFLAIAACVVLAIVVLQLVHPIWITQTIRGPEMKVDFMPAGSAADMATLSTEIPPELIEGTPKPINVPNLEAPVRGPAGSSSWGSDRSRFVERRNETDGDQQSESLANLKKRNINDPASRALALERPRSNVARVMAEGAQADRADLGELAADDSLKSIEGVSAFESKRAAGGLSGGAGSGSSFGLQANQPPAPAAAPVMSPEPAARAKASKDMAAADTPALPDMDLAKLQSTSISESPGQVRAGAVTGFVQPESETDLYDGNSGGAGGGFGGGEADPFAEPATAGQRILGGVEHRFAYRQSSELDKTAPPPTLGRRGGEQPADVALGVVAGQLSFAGKKMEAAEKVPVLGERVTAAKEMTVAQQPAEIDTRSNAITPPGQPKPATAVTAGTMTLSGGIAANQPESQPAVPPPAKAERKSDEMLRTNSALTDEHTATVDKVRSSLYTAEGNYNLGKYDDAKREYEAALRTDPYNAAARRGLERIASEKSDNYRAAYDHTRAELLSQVDNAWELSVPAEETSDDKGVKAGEKASVLTDGASKADLFFDTSKVAEGTKSSGGVEYEIHTGNSSEYAFKGKDLGDSESLRKAIQDQEDKVEERRKVLATIVRTKGIIYKGTDSFYRQSGVDEDQGAKNALQTFHELEQEKGQVEAQLADLAKNVAGQPVEEAAKRQATLKAQLELATDRLKSVEVMKDQTREEAITRGLDAQDYVDAKKEFEEDQALLQQMKQKLYGAPAKAKPEPPKVDLTKLMEEIAATEDPYSTFSLNISDASFQVAQAALAKGERPDPAGIKVEQFYNAVDYGDPAPAAGEPVAVNIEQSAHPVIPGRNLVRVALKTAAAGRSAAQPLRLTLLVDQSGSMVREDRRAAMDKALAGLAGLLTDKDLVTVVGFSRIPRLLADGLTGDKAGKLADLVNLAANEGGTNLEEALKLGEQLADRSKLAGAQNRIVLFTDGAANLGNADPARLAEKVKQLRQKGIAFDIAGIAADGLNDELLGELARNGNGRYYVVGKGADDNLAKQLAGAFRPAAENVKVQVRFNPERVGRYKLIGFEKDRLKTEDFRNDTVDAAELAAEEAGVAVYQVEPLPGGNGELGEVSVRFRDAASAQMVERTWTIPHDDKAPAFDRAAPSMQLAVLSMLAAEKLKGGPLGDAIDFKQLAEPRANVKRFYGTNGRVGEVLNMVDALK